MAVTKENWESDYREASRRRADPTILDDIYRNYQASGGTKSADEILAENAAVRPENTAAPAVAPAANVYGPNTSANTAAKDTPAQNPENAFQRISAPDTSGVRTTLDQWLSNAQKQSGARIDESVRQSVNELARTQEQADAAYQTQRNQVDIDEARARDNQALYAAAQGDRGGIGAAQYDSIANTAARNRQTIRTEQTKLRTDILRQIADIRAQGDFQKEQAALEAANQYLSQLFSLEQLELSNQLTVAQFNAQVEQARMNYELQLRQLEVSSDQFNRQFAYQQGRDAVADARYTDETAYSRGIDERNYNYQLGRDAIADARYADETAYSRGIDERNYNYQLNRDAIADSRYTDETAYNRGIYADETAYSRSQTERGNAYTLAMTALNAGFLPDSDTLTAAGISPEYAKQYKLYVEAQTALQAASGTAASGAGQSVYDWLRQQGATDYGTAYDLLQRNDFNSTDANRFAKYYAETWLPANPAPTSASASATISGATVKSVIDIAAKEIGYQESGNNQTKYGAWFGQDGQPWCVQWAYWVMDQAGLSALMPSKTASSTEFARNAREMNQWVTGDYQPGDIVVFDWTKGDGKYDHIGIVSAVSADGKSMSVISGNSGNAVAKVNYTQTDSRVAGAFRPLYGRYVSLSGSGAANTANSTAQATALPASVTAPTSAYGTNYNSIWKNCREMFDGARAATKNMTPDQRREYIMKYLDQQSETSLTDAGLKVIMTSLNLGGYRD